MESTKFKILKEITSKKLILHATISVTILEKKKCWKNIYSTQLHQVLIHTR